MKNNNKELFEILDEALDRVLKGEDLHNVLADYPRHADELEPLLKTALSTRDAAAIQPRPEFRQRAAMDFQKAIQQMPVKNVSQTAAVKPRRGIFGWGVAWSSAIAMILTVLVSGTGVVAASTNALPDSPLYSVKIAVENVQMAFTPTETGKTELLAKFNDNRVDELVVMAERGNVDEMNALNTRIAGNMVQMADLSGGTMANSVDAAGNWIQTESFGSKSYTASMEQSGATGAGDTLVTFDGVQAPQTTVPATTRPPANTNNVPPPAETTHPAAVSVVPAPTTSTLVTVQSPEFNSRSFGLDDEKGKTSGEDRWDELKELLSSKQIKNLRSLLEAYRNASKDSRTEMLSSIRIIIVGYGLENNTGIEAILKEYGLTMDMVFG